VAALLLTAAVAIPLAFDNAPARAQAGVALMHVDVAVVGKGYRASKLIGSGVVNDKNEKIGTLDDIVVDKQKVLFAILQVGGFLGVGARLVAMPYDSLKIDDVGKRIELPGASKDELKKLPEFTYRTS
jgi:sporulation protein YlmC with PRC-barrel domain